jgi:hypothetical protein
VNYREEKYVKLAHDCVGYREEKYVNYREEKYVKLAHDCVGYREEKYVKLAHDFVQWLALVSVVLMYRIML